MKVRTIFLFLTFYALILNAGAELDIDAIEQQLAEYKEKSIASNLHANNINIQANNTATIQGSNLTADNEINIAAKDTNIQASRDVATSKTSTKHQNITLGYEVYGGVTTSTSADTAQSTSTQLQHTNSLLQANTININTQETTTIQGANLHANQQLNINTNNLEVSSVQNTASSNSNSKSFNLSTSGFTPTGAGGSLSKSSSSSAQTLLTSLSAEEVNINVEEATTLKGATIASTDQDGNDNNNLNLTTNTLNISSLNNISKSKSISVGANIGGSFENNTLNNVSIDFSNNTANSKTKTLATLGEGNIQVADIDNSNTQMLNRDIANNEIDIYDIESHQGLQGELDTRLLTQEGRNQIKEDILKSSMITDTINQIVTNETVDVTDFFDNVDKEYKTFDAIKKKIAQTPELASMLQDSTLSTEQKELMMDAITDEVMAKLGYKTVDNKIINTTSSGRDEAQTKGFYSEETGNSYINERYVTTNEGLIATSGGEAQRAIDSQNNENWSDEQRSDRAEFVQHVGENIVDYTNFSMNINGYDNGISTSQNNIEQPKTVTQTPSVFNNSVANNNQDFTVLDKNKGDNLCVNSMDCYGNKTETAFLKTQSVMTNEHVGNYNLINQVNPDNGNVEYYSLYNNQTGNTINLKPQELDNLQQMAETNPEAFKNIMAVYEMQSNTTHTVYNAITGVHDDGYLGGNLDAWQKEITSGEILFDIASGGVAAKVEKNLVKTEVKFAEKNVDLVTFDEVYKKAPTATVDSRKFSDYIFKPEADHGKDAVFKSLGYSAEDSTALASIWEKQATEKFAKGEFSLGKADQYGQRINIEIALPKKGSITEQTSYVKSGWMIQPDGSIKLNTPFSGFTRNEK